MAGMCVDSPVRGRKNLPPVGRRTAGRSVMYRRRVERTGSIGSHSRGAVRARSIPAGYPTARSRIGLPMASGSPSPPKLGVFGFASCLPQVGIQSSWNRVRIPAGLPTHEPSLLCAVKTTIECSLYLTLPVNGSRMSRAYGRAPRNRVGLDKLSSSPLA